MIRRTNTLIITNDCNLRCAYCYIEGKQKVSMPINVLEAAIAKLPRTTETIWEFIGGEPLLEPDLIGHAINLLEQRGEQYIASITTNGTLFGDKKVRELLEMRPCRKNVGLSLDGPQCVHDANRCDSFNCVMEHFDWWRKTFPNSATKSTINKKTLPHISESVQFLVKLGLTTIPMNIVYEEDWTKDDEKIYKKQIEDVGDFLIDSGNVDKVSVSFLNRVFTRPTQQKRNWCGSGEYMIAVDPAGNLYPCNRFAENDLPPFGSLDTGIDENRVYPFKVSHFKTDKCSICEIMGACPGCLAYDYLETGTIFKRSTKGCSMHKVLIEANKVFWEKVQKQ